MKHLLPPLPYAVSALEPHIDARTMVLHHDMHHASYIKKLNLALASAPELLQGKTADWLLRNLSDVPEKMRTAIRNNAGGHANHSLLWESMCAGGGGAPSGSLAKGINADFGGFEEFKVQFEAAGSQLFGSGWVWLVRAQRGDGRLQILTTSGHDNPVTQGYDPLLVNDVWEHAYYLKHENRRPEYLHGWWSVVNWRAVEQRLARSLDSAELSPG